MYTYNSGSYTTPPICKSPEALSCRRVYFYPQYFDKDEGKQMKLPEGTVLDRKAITERELHLKLERNGDTADFFVFNS